MSPTKTTAKKAAMKKAATKKAPAKKSPAKKAVAKKPAVKKVAAKKVVAKKVVAKKPAAKKPAAKKSEAKTKPTGASVDAHIGAITDPGRRQDCRTLVEVFSQATGKPARMWGPSIVAFGKYHYKYDSGREGDSCLAGFASRKGALTLYLMGTVAGNDPLLQQIGKHKTGKGCLYLKNLDEVDLQVLGQLVRNSADYVRSKYPTDD